VKTIAVVGAGFAGLAAAYYLSKKYRVTLLDQKGIGAGASGVSSGLLHPYPGEKGRRSWQADEALKLAKQLIEEAEAALGRVVSDKRSILRQGPILNPGSDVIPIGPEQFLITSGMTIFPSLYLEGLWLLCEQRGVQFRKEKVETTKSLGSYDLIIVAVGAGIRFLEEKKELKINFVKGQVLTCSLDAPLERSVSSKIYTALTASSLECHVGATYEREVTDEIPSLEIATRLLKPRYPVIDCRAGIRVTNPAHYFPILQQLDERRWVITALGSRGLLYHALLGHQLALSI
jgi:glycine/D-amino acid oxidase-like deaminating enzyme